MILDNFWKYLFLVVVAVLGFYWWDKNRDERVFEAKVEQLAAFLNPQQFTSDSESKRFEAAFLKAVAYLEKESRAGADIDAILAGATERYALEKRHAQYVAECFKNALESCDRFGIFDLSGRNTVRMEGGRPPTIEDGPYAGHELVVTPIISPLLAPGAANDFANAALVPAPVRAFNDEVLTSKSYEYLLRLESAGVVSRSDAARIKEFYRENKESS